MSQDDAGFTLKALWALRDDRVLDAATQRVAVALVMYADASGECHPSVRRLASTARTSPGAVRRALLKLSAGHGPIRLKIIRSNSEHGDPDAHRYAMALVGWDQANPTPDQGSPTRDQASPRVGSGEPHGVGSGDTGGGIRRAPEEDIEEDKKKRTGKRAPASRTAPSDFVPSEADLRQEDEAKRAGVDVELQRKKWRNHSYKRPVVDFHAAWRNWLLNSIEFLRSAKPRSAPQETPVGATFDDDAERRTEALLRQGTAKGQVVMLPIAGGTK